MELPRELKYLFDSSEVQVNEPKGQLEFLDIQKMQVGLKVFELNQTTTMGNMVFDISQSFLNVLEKDAIVSDDLDLNDSNWYQLFKIKLLLGSNLVATEGYVGPATHVLIGNKLAYKLGLIDDINTNYVTSRIGIKLHLVRPDLEQLKFRFFIDSRVDSSFYMWRNNLPDQFGIKLVWIPPDLDIVRDQKIDSVIYDKEMDMGIKYNILVIDKTNSISNQSVKFNLKE